MNHHRTEGEFPSPLRQSLHQLILISTRVCWIQTTKNIGKKTKGEKPENFHHPADKKPAPQTMATTKSSITRQSKLFPDEPHYIPGYRGYCPQMNFKMGDTYGKTTHGILTDGKIAKSKRRVLAQTSSNASRECEQYLAESEEAQISRNRRAISYGDKKLMHNMVPGYTGYIPKKEDHFGNRYAVGCHRAISNFENDRTAYSRNESDRLHGGFLKMSYFGVKKGQLRSFLGKKT